VRGLGTLFEDLQPERPLPGDHPGVVEGVDVEGAVLLGELPPDRPQLARRVSPVDARARRLDRMHLVSRSGGRDEHVGG
jgi:hypothetical protein